MTSRCQASRWCWLVAMAWLCLGPPACGANAVSDYLLEVWNSENGLPDSSVTAVAQTPDGYLWVGTYNGLVRFDGVRFVTFDPANTPALTHARVRRLSVDSRGTLWISTYDGALTRYQAGMFALERRNPHASEGEVNFVGIASNRVVFVTSRGELILKPFQAPPGEGWEEIPPPARGIGALCCLDGTGTLWYRDGDRQLWRLRGNQFEALPDTAGLDGQNVNCLTTDPLGRMWVGTDREFAIWDGTTFQSAVPGQTPLNVECLAVTGQGRIWAMANGCVCEAFARRWLLEPQAMRGGFARVTGRVAAQSDHRGGMWFYNYGGGLLHVDANGEPMQMTEEDGFPGDRVYCFFEDQEGNWWAGLDAVGLVRVRARQFHLLPSPEKNLTRATRSVCEDRHGNVWIGRLSGGLDCWQEGRVTNYALPDAGANAVFCAWPDAAGRLWLSGGDEDLLVREQGVFTRITPTLHGVKSLLVDHADRVWVGTTTGLLLSQPGLPTGFQPFKSMPRRTIRALAEDRTGNIWGGTGSGELFCIPSNSASATLFRPDDSPESGASAIWSVLADADGTIWAGTFRGGLLRWRDGKFTRYDKHNELPDDVICQLLDDQRGNLWLGSHQGVFRVAKSALNEAAQVHGGYVPCVTYGRSDGLPSLECSGGYQPSAWRDQAGRLWFTTAKGATWIQPEEVQANPKPPPVVIESVVVDGRPQEWSPINGLVLPPGRHQIEFRYTGLSLASPERVHFRYQLANLDSDWVQAGTRRSAQYGFLPPGSYRFQVLAGNSDGVWNHEGAALDLTIRPHYYETWWFQVLAVMAVLGTVAGVARQLATRRLHRRMEELERKQVVERERARIAKDIHDDLGANLTLIAVLGDLARKEKTAERIEKMSHTAREAVKSLDEIVWAVNPRNDTLPNLVDYTGQFATDYLRDAGIRCRLDVPDHIPAREVPANVRHNIFLVVKEALQNIVKHAHATEVWLRINPGPRELSISIEDNGRGFDRPPEDAWADGLRNLRQRLAEIGGECRITSQVNQGTTIAVQLPLPPINP